MNLYKEEKVREFGKSIENVNINTAQNTKNSIMVFLNYRNIVCVSTRDINGKWNPVVDNMWNSKKYLDTFLYQVDDIFLQNNLNKI